MVSDYVPQIDSARCIGCELCVKLCPTNALGLVNDIAAVTAAERCTYTGICQEICPTEAISLRYIIILSREGTRNRRT
jgi:formate hydrogenlyase subunit 6/NADH:ubiquinone oxidoreductase subunit I